MPKSSGVTFRQEWAPSTPFVSYTAYQEESRHSCAANDALGQPPMQPMQAATEVLPGREYGVAGGHLVHADAPSVE
jgi:hypothetical protein